MRCTLQTLFAVAVCLTSTEKCLFGSKPDLNPHPSVLLEQKGNVLVRHGPDTLGEYGARDGKLIRTFTNDTFIHLFEVSSDQQSLVVVGRFNRVTAWDLRTGKKRWSAQVPRDPGVRTAFDVAFSQDGSALVIAASALVVLDARTGALRKVLADPDLSAMSAALAPDGKAGMAASLSGGLWSFEVDAGKLRPAGRKGYGTVRYSSDGKHVACLAKRGEGVTLRVLSTAKGLPFKDIGDYYLIELLQPTPDGRFYYDVRLNHHEDETCDSAGMRYDPRTGKAEQVWHMPLRRGYVTGGASSTALMLSVETDYRYVTKITDLRTWRVITIDNSARHKMEWISGSFGPDGKKLGGKPDPPNSKPVTEKVDGPAAPPGEGGPGTWRTGPALALIAAGIALVGWALWRRRRVAAPSA